MLWFAALLLAQPVPQQQCAAMDANLPAPLAAWTKPGMGLAPGNAVWLRTISGMYGAVLKAYEPGEPVPGYSEAEFKIERAGVYGIAADQPVWIDVIPQGASQPLTSARHGHGPECTTIRKIVGFDLQPGNYLLRLTKVTVDRVKVMLVAPD